MSNKEMREFLGDFENQLCEIELGISNLNCIRHSMDTACDNMIENSLVLTENHLREAYDNLGALFEHLGSIDFEEVEGTGHAE